MVDQERRTAFVTIAGAVIAGSAFALTGCNHDRDEDPKKAGDEERRLGTADLRSITASAVGTEGGAG